MSGTPSAPPDPHSTTPVNLNKAHHGKPAKLANQHDWLDDAAIVPVMVGRTGSVIPGQPEDVDDDEGEDEDEDEYEEEVRAGWSKTTAGTKLQRIAQPEISDISPTHILLTKKHNLLIVASLLVSLAAGLRGEEGRRRTRYQKTARYARWTRPQGST